MEYTTAMKQLALSHADGTVAHVQVYPYTCTEFRLVGGIVSEMTVRCFSEEFYLVGYNAM